MAWSWTVATSDPWILFKTGWMLWPLTLLSELPTFCIPCMEPLNGPDTFWRMAWDKNVHKSYKDYGLYRYTNFFCNIIYVKRKTFWKSRKKRVSWQKLEIFFFFFFLGRSGVRSKHTRNNSIGWNAYFVIQRSGLSILFLNFLVLRLQPQGKLSICK